jgi:cytochrome c553
MKRTAISIVIAGALTTLATVAPAKSTQRTEMLQVERARPDLARGEEYFRSCAVCHGPRGEGAADGTVPVIAGQHFRVIAKQLIDYRYGKRWDPRMEQVANRHSMQHAQAVADVAAYVSQLDRQPKRGVGAGNALEYGADVYARECSDCHGAAGEGSAKERVPFLAAQHYEYLLRQIYDAVDGRRPNMPRNHVRLFKKLQLKDIQAVADFLSRIEPMPPARGATGGTTNPGQDDIHLP